jgi:hypothetical protein
MDGVDGSKCANGGCTKPGLHLCARCRDMKYCSAACQKVHWKQGGHKQECIPSAPKASSAVLATSKPSKAAVAAGSGSGSEAGTCTICLESNPPPIQSGCACRGDAGLAHVECRAMAAGHRMANNNTYEGWQSCATCGQQFTGAMRLGLADARWSTVERLPEEDGQRMAAAMTLATALQAQGMYAKAEPLFRKLLASAQRLLGPEHHNTLLAAANLVAALGSQGKCTEAETICHEVYAVQIRVLGPEDPRALITAVNLAMALQSQGRYVEAESLLRETLTVERRVLGSEHPRALKTTASLANALNSQGRYVEAETMFREVLVVQRRVLGAEHPDTLMTAANLSYALYAQGKLCEAEEIYRETIAAMQRVLGPEHPHTLTASENLAAFIRSARGMSDSAHCNE